MTAPHIGSQRPRLCPRDNFELVLDHEIVRTSIDAGWPAVALFRCRLGHSVREWPAEARHGWTGRQKPCAVCGRLLPIASGYGGSGGRKYHAGACAATAFRERQRWSARHPGQVFLLELAPWYRGPLYLARPLSPLDPLAGRMPREWADGWLRGHGLRPVEDAV